MSYVFPFPYSHSPIPPSHRELMRRPEAKPSWTGGAYIFELNENQKEGENILKTF
jgi:hypothetical protein